MKKMKSKILSYILVLVLSLSCLAGCGTEPVEPEKDDNITSIEETLENTANDVVDDLESDDIENTETDTNDDGETTNNESTERVDVINVTAADYNGSPYIVINNNNPYFTDSEKKNTTAFEKYSELDHLGRCGEAFANICKELMPTADRESISSVKPTGWKNKEYSFVDGRWVYNRAHIIGFQLAGENANEKNLITGTRYMNVQGMLPFENMIDDYVDETNNHVLYRVTPMFVGKNLLCEGVLMEAWSVEDDGDGICFNVFCFNVEPGVTIDYETGDNWEDGSKTNKVEKDETNKVVDNTSATYILNTNTKKFHEPDCASAAKTATKNKKEYSGNRADLINDGYSPCGNCHP